VGGEHPCNLVAYFLKDIHAFLNSDEKKGKLNGSKRISGRTPTDHKEPDLPNCRGIVAFNFSPRNLTQVTSAMKPVQECMVGFASVKRITLREGLH